MPDDELDDAPAEKSTSAAEDKAMPAAPEDKATLRGHLKIELHGPDGELKHSSEVENLVTTVGKNLVADQLLAAPTLGKPTHMAVGHGAVAPAPGDTTLGAEDARVALTSKTRTGNVVTMVGDFGAGVATGVAISEAGLFDAAAAGNMSNRVTFGPYPTKGAGDTLRITWTLTVG